MASAVGKLKSAKPNVYAPAGVTLSVVLRGVTVAFALVFCAVMLPENDSVCLAEFVSMQFVGLAARATHTENVPML